MFVTRRSDGEQIKISITLAMSESTCANTLRSYLTKLIIYIIIIIINIIKAFGVQTSVKIAPHKPPRSMPTPSVSTGTYYGGVVTMGKERRKEIRCGLRMAGRPADYRKNITILRCFITYYILLFLF